MKFINYLLHFIVSAFFSSADPNLFGSVKRRKEKAAIADTFQSEAEDTQNEIDKLAVANPFESAAAKSAMKASSRSAKQMQQKYANMLGGNANPEAAVAAQSATQEAIGSTAGDIAVGAEANQAAQIAQLRGEKGQQLAQGAAADTAAIDERGSGWEDFFGAMDSVAGLAGGASGVMGAI